MSITAHKSKTKKNKEIKSFAPIAFESFRIEWNESELNTINDLKKKYGFSDNYDLAEHLARMDTEVKTFEEYDRLKPTEKETIDYHKKIKIKASQSISSLRKIKSLLPAPAKKTMR